MTDQRMCATATVVEVYINISDLFSFSGKFVHFISFFSQRFPFHCALFAYMLVGSGLQH